MAPSMSYMTMIICGTQTPLLNDYHKKQDVRVSRGRTEPGCAAAMLPGSILALQPSLWKWGALLTSTKVHFLVSVGDLQHILLVIKKPSGHPLPQPGLPCRPTLKLPIVTLLCWWPEFFEMISQNSSQWQQSPCMNVCLQHRQIKIF